MISISSNVDRIISQVEAYRNTLDPKLSQFMERLAMIGATEARVRFSYAMYAGRNDVEIEVVPIGTKAYKIVASGEAVLFIEFGTGITHPTLVEPSGLTYPHGTYGKGKGANPNGWVYVGEQGNAGQTLREGVYRTKGNPPARAMYRSAKEMRAEILRIAREVFR